MIAYFDTSSVVPLIISEPATQRCNQLWSTATRVVSVRLLYPEARAALAKAERMGRITRQQLIAAVTELDDLMSEVDHIEVTEELAYSAGELAQVHGLRGYDAVHLAAATSVADGDVVLVTGDDGLAKAATAIGISVALTKL